MHTAPPSMLSATNKVIGITGATGFIGQSLCEQLQQAGFTIIKLIRSKSVDDTGNFYRHFDLEKPEDIKPDQLRGIDILIHAAWIYEKRMPVANSFNLISTRKLAAVAKEAGVQQLIFFSSMAAHEKSSSFYGQTKLIAESYFDQTKDLVLRPGFVIGNGGLGGRLIDYARTKKLIPLVNGGNQPLHCISVKQLAEVVQDCIQENKKGNYLLGEKEAITYKEFFTTVAAYYQRRLRFVSLPSGLLRLMIRATSFFRITLPVTEENLDGLLSLIRYNTKTDSVFPGIREEGLASMLQQADERLKLLY